jgi:hypothetical protein
MHKLVPVLVLIATAPVAVRVPVAAELRSVGTLSNPSAVAISGADAAVVFVGGMGGGGTGGGMGGGMGGGGMGGGGMGGGGMGGGGMGGGGMGGGGMGGGMTGGGMGGGGMTGYGGIPGSGVGGGMTGYGSMPSTGVGRPNGGDDTSGGGAQPTQSYHCVTQHGQCTVSSSPGSLRPGVSCSCLIGGRGKIK